MKYAVSVSLEVEADDPEAAVAIAFASLSDDVPRTLNVLDVTSMITDINLKHSTARDPKAAGKSIPSKEVDEILYRI
jgi:hypothetical protein